MKIRKQNISRVESETEVRQGLKDAGYNIELVEKLSDAHLNYEKKNNVDFKVENL